MTVCYEPYRHRPAGRPLKRMMRPALDRQFSFTERETEINDVVLMLNVIALVRGEDMWHGAAGSACYRAMALRIERRVRNLLSIDWELRTAKEMIDEYLPDIERRHTDVQGLGDLPA